MKEEMNWSLPEIDGLYPYEFDIYYGLTVKHLKDRTNI
jgi:hypothetical protein